MPTQNLRKQTIINEKAGFPAKLLLCFVIAALSFLIVLAVAGCSGSNSPKTVVFQSDFGEKDGAVAAMKGVSASIDSDLKLYDLTHEIPSYSVWDASYRLYQSVEYWPEGTVFVSVVDPGVGSDRKSVVAKTNDNKYIVTPDNGTLSFLKDSIKEARIIDETTNRLPGSNDSYTFHGRDVYAYTAARLASGQITFDQVGSITVDNIVELNYQKPKVEGDKLIGSIDILDVQYGNVWTNLSKDMAQAINLEVGKNYRVKIMKDGVVKYDATLPYCNSFSEVPEGSPLMYINSLRNLSFALNLGNFAESYGISYGEGWTVEISNA